MMRFPKVLAVLLCICLSVALCACGGQDETPTQPTQNTTPSDTTEHTEAATPDYAAVYRAARTAAEGASDITLTFTWEQNRTVAGETYRSTSTGSAVYTAYGTDEMQALVCEDLAFGTYEVPYYSSYLSGQGYCRVENCNFRCDMTAEEFLKTQLPVVVLNESNYAAYSVQVNEDSLYYTFTDALQLENWAQTNASMTLILAHGTAELGSEGNLIRSTYHAEYDYGGVTYTLDVAVEIDTATAPDFSGQPVYPEDCAVLNDIQIPRLLIQVVGDLFDTENLTANYTDALYCEAFDVIRIQSGSCNAYGSANDMIAEITTQVSVIDYTDTAVTNSQTISYANGLYSYATNNSDPVTVAGITADDVRIYCEDTILTTLFSLSSISKAEITETDGFLYIEFTGSDEYSDSICSNIYSIFGLDLDNYAESYETTSAGGYLALNRWTGLPTAMGQYLQRNHTISGVPFRLTYQLDQALELPSQTALQTLTGESDAESPPAETAAPLFYHVTGEDGQEMWLLGTIHLGDERTGFLPDQIMNAFNAADALAVEFNTLTFNDTLLSDSTLQAELTSAYYYTDGSTAQSHLDDELADQLTMLMRISGYNDINGPYRKVSIWNSLLEDFYLAQGCSLKSDKGVDSRLLSWAMSQGKTVYEIESGISQIQMLTGFSDELQQLLLQELLSSGLTGYCSEVQELYELWCSGNEEALTSYLITDTSEMTDEELALWEEYNKAMYTDRNKVMLKAAKSYLKSEETVFYAVGLAHLLGEGGLVQALRDAGYTVELVTYTYE